MLPRHRFPIVGQLILQWNGTSCRGFHDQTADDIYFPTLPLVRNCPRRGYAKPLFKQENFVWTKAFFWIMVSQKNMTSSIWSITASVISPLVFAVRYLTANAANPFAEFLHAWKLLEWMRHYAATALASMLSRYLS